MGNFPLSMHDLEITSKGFKIESPQIFKVKIMAKSLWKITSWWNQWRIKVKRKINRFHVRDQAGKQSFKGVL